MWISLIPAVVHEISGFGDAVNCKLFEKQVFPAKLVALQILLVAHAISDIDGLRSAQQKADNTGLLFQMLRSGVRGLLVRKAVSDYCLHSRSSESFPKMLSRLHS